MTNKINSIKTRSKRTERNADDNPRKETNNIRNAKSGMEQGETKGTIEQVSRRGYYSRNGGYGGYRGL